MEALGGLLGKRCPYRWGVKGRLRGASFDDNEAACWTCAVVALAILEPSLDTLVPEYVLAWKSDRLVDGAEGLAADYAFLGWQKQCIEVPLHLERWTGQVINRQQKR